MLTVVMNALKIVTRIQPQETCTFACILLQIDMRMETEVIHDAISSNFMEWNDINMWKIETV